jgi:hypothetical protein
MVVSVGPYMFQTSPAATSSRRARSGAIASPPLQTRTARLRQPASSSRRKVAGVAWSQVIRCSAITSARRAPSLAVSRSTSTTGAPMASGRNISTTEMSKDTGVTPIRRSLSPAPGQAATEASTLASPPWVTRTPFGRPVEPEV